HTAGADEVVSSVYVDAAATPAAAPAPTAAPGGADCQANAKRNCAGREDCTGSVVWRIPDRWIRITHWSPDIRRIVGRHIDHLRIGLFDHDHLLVLDCLFL